MLAKNEYNFSYRFLLETISIHKGTDFLLWKEELKEKHVYVYYTYIAYNDDEV